jgi:type IX secretion system PorP/SprF family membrane protein
MRFEAKYILLITFLLAIAFGTKAQDSYYSQYYNNMTYYNPAYIGLDEGLKVGFTYRDQWPKYSDDLKTYNFNMDFAERGLPGLGGFGIIFNSNKEGNGLIKTNFIGLLGSARIRLQRHWVTQVGVTVAFVQKQIDVGDFIWSDQLDDRHGLLYPESSFAGLPNQSISYADVNLGGLIKYEKRLITATLGFGINHLFKPNESFYNLDIRVPRKYDMNIDVVFLQRNNPRKGFKFNPGLLYEYQNSFSNFSLGMNVQKSIIYAGAWYRNRNSAIYNVQSLMFVVGVQIPMVNKYSRIKLMYSYDVGISNMKGTGGAHEITLRFQFDEIHLIKSNSYFSRDYPVIMEPLRF